MSATAPTPSLRTWPVLLLLLLLWGLRWLPAFVSEHTPPVFMVAFIGPAAATLLVLLWWIAGSRASRREKVLGLVGFVAIALGTTLVAHESFQGFGTMASAIPWGGTAFAIGALAADRLRRRSRTAIALGLTLVAFGSWDLVRIDGVWGDFRFEHHWRWAESAEQQFLADRGAGSGDEVGGAAGALTSELAEWPGFRGPERDSVVPGVTLGEAWDTAPPKELWRIRVGPGWGSFAVAGRRLFTQEQRGDEEVVVAYDRESGAELWSFGYRSKFWEAMGGVGPRATPTHSSSRLFALGTEGHLHRLDPATGELVWHADLRVDADREPPEWGFTASPLVVDDLVVVHAGGHGDRGLLAYDAETGALRWGAPAGSHTYASPQLERVLGRTSIAMVTDDGMSLVEPADGTVRWHYEWPFENYRVLQPLFLDESSFLMSTGFGVGTRRLDLRVTGETLAAEERWTSRGMKPDFNDFAAHGAHLYGFDGGIFACIDLETGERVWKGGRYGHGQLLLLPESDQILVSTEQGDLVLLRADPSGHEELGRVGLFDAKTWNHPVLVGDRLYLRNGEEAVALELPTS